MFRHIFLHGSQRGVHFSHQSTWHISSLEPSSIQDVKQPIHGWVTEAFTYIFVFMLLPLNSEEQSTGNELTRQCYVRGVRGGEACGKSGSSSSPAVPLPGFYGEGALAGEAGLANGSAVSSTVSTCEQRRLLRGSSSRSNNGRQYTCGTFVAAVACEHLTIQQAMAYFALITQFA